MIPLIALMIPLALTTPLALMITLRSFKVDPILDQLNHSAQAELNKILRIRSKACSLLGTHVHKHTWPNISHMLIQCEAIE